MLDEADLAGGCTLRDITLPPGSLVMMIRRGERYIVPTARRRLAGDALLIIKEEDRQGVRCEALHLVDAVDGGDVRDD